MNDPLVPVLCVVEDKRRDSDDVFTLEIRPPGGSLGFEPGQFNMLYAPRAGESAISISGDPGEPGRLVHTIRALGNVTRLLEATDTGESIGVRGPFGRGWPIGAAAGRDLVIMAGGIGLAPLRPLLYHVGQHRKTFGQVTLLYGARTPADILFRDELIAMQADGILDLGITVDATSGAWTGHVGVVTNLIPRARFSPDNTIAMLCGPEIMMRHSVLGLMERGVAAGDIYVSMERNMKCATAFCGHCQFGPHFICKDGPVFAYPVVNEFFGVREF